MKKISYIFISFFSLIYAGSLHAQNPNITNLDADQYFSDYKKDKDMEIAESGKTMLNSGPQYGAWITPSFLYSNMPSQTLSSFILATRIWGKSYLWPYSYIYIRAKDKLRTIIYQNNYNYSPVSNQVDLEDAFIAISTPKQRFQAQVGRKLYQLGTGLILNGQADGIDLKLNLPYTRVQAFTSFTGFLQSDEELIYNLAGDGSTKISSRLFSGGSVTVDLLNQNFYVMTLHQIDFNKYKYYRRAKYDSSYYGAGLKGSIQNLSYYAEGIHQRGKSYTTQAYHGSSINAWAFNSGLNYYFDYKFKPAVSLNYSFGTGDGNRYDARKSTGNNWGRDHGFLYFGSYNGGYGLRPYLSNIHVIRAGFLLSPFEYLKIKLFQKFTIIGKYTYYLKYKNTAPINQGSDANRRNRNIGQGIDIGLRWQILSDVGFFFNYAVFLPGKAYGIYYSRQYLTIISSSRSPRHFVMGGFNFSL